MLLFLCKTDQELKPHLYQAYFNLRDLVYCFTNSTLNSAKTPFSRFSKMPYLLSRSKTTFRCWACSSRDDKTIRMSSTWKKPNSKSLNILLKNFWNLENLRGIPKTELHFGRFREPNRSDDRRFWLEEMARNFVKEIEELNKPYVHIKDPEKLNVKLNGIISGSFQELQVVSDFDLTITKQHENGQRHLSSFRMFGFCPSLTDEFKQKSADIYKKYHPYEYDPTIPENEKKQIMEEWWQQTEKVLDGLTVSSKEIDEVVSNLSISVRDGTKDLFQTLSDHDVPILVFSAGLGNTVISVLKSYDVYLPNVKVISNFLKYDDNEIIRGFKGPLIHVLNKNEFAIKNSEYYDLVKNRNNVILLGDSLGDAKMADGIDHANHVLKIGFIFEEVEGNLPAYMDTFDIVLEDDQTMDVIRAIIRLIKISQ